MGQDPLGMQGRKVWDDGPREVWVKPLADGSRAVILFNRGNEECPLSVSWEDVGLFPGGSATVRDRWTKKDLGSVDGPVRDEGRLPRRRDAEGHREVLKPSAVSCRSAPPPAG